MNKRQIKKYNGKLKKHFPPAIYILDYLADIQMAPLELATASNIKPNVLEKILNNEMDLGIVNAQKISNAIGGSVQTWLNLQKSYNAYKRKLK